MKKIIIAYIVIMLGLVIFIFTSNGDTPIGPALLALLPWGLFFGQKLKVVHEFAPFIANILINLGILVALSKIFKKSSSTETLHTKM